MAGHRGFLISDEAWSNLRNQAIVLGYCNHRNQNAKGISQYLTALSDCNFKDNRTWKDNDPLYLPLWLENYGSNDTIVKVLTLNCQVVANLALIAAEFCITRPGQKQFTQRTLAANTLEAIGLDRLVPLNLMPSSKTFRKKKRWIEL